MKLARKNCHLKYSKWFHHIGTLRVVKKMGGNGELRMVIQDHPCGRDWITLTDTNVKDVFVWLGRYLALKGKLPKNIALEEIAVASQRITKSIREVNATDIYRNELEQLK